MVRVRALAAAPDVHLRIDDQHGSTFLGSGAIGSPERNSMLVRTMGGMLADQMSRAASDEVVPFLRGSLDRSSCVRRRGWERDRLKLADALGVTGDDVVAMVGGGGKTTAMFRLAREMVDEVCTR